MKFKSRLDRLLYKNTDNDTKPKIYLESMQMVGTDASVYDYEKDKYFHPSDHFGLLVEFRSKSNPEI